MNAFSPCAIDDPSYVVSVYVDAGRLFGGHAIEVMLERDGALLGEAALVG